MVTSSSLAVLRILCVVAAALNLLLAQVMSLRADDADRVKVALVAMHSEMGQPEVNLARIAEFSNRARQQHATFVVFTEEGLTGSLNNTDLSRAEIVRIVEQAERAAAPRLEELAKKNQQTLIVGSIVQDGEKFRNAALIVGPSGLMTVYHKLWLPNENENAFFQAGTELPVIESQGWTFSVGICADLDRGEYFAAAAHAGAELFLLPIAGSGFAELVGADGDQSKQAAKHRELHERIMQNWGRQYGLYVGYANQSGKSGPNWYPGLSLAVGPTGKTLGVHAPDEGMLVVECSRAELQLARNKLPRNPVIPELKNSSGQPVKIRSLR